MISNFRVAWLLSYISIASISAAIITPGLPQIQLYFGLKVGQVEWMISAFLIGYVIGQLIYGPLANRWGRVLSLRIGLTVNLIGILICFLSLAFNAYWLMIIGRLISALGAAGGLACTFMIINEWLHESQRKTAMAYSILSFTLGIGIAVSIGGIITEYLHWTYCFLVLLIQAITMLWGTRFFNETLKIPQAINISLILSNYKQAFLSKTLVLFALVVGFCSMIGYCFSAAGPMIANDLLGLSAAEYGYWNFFNMIGMLLGGLGAKALLDRLSAYKVVAAGFIGSALGILSLAGMIISQANSPLWFFTSTLILYLFSGLLFAAGSYLASNALSDKASSSAIMSFINMSSATLAVVIMGYLSTNPLHAFVYVLSGMWVLMVILLVLNSTQKVQKIVLRV